MCNCCILTDRGPDVPFPFFLSKYFLTIWFGLRVDGEAAGPSEFFIVQTAI